MTVVISSRKAIVDSRFSDPSFLLYRNLQIFKIFNGANIRPQTDETMSDFSLHFFYY